MKRIVPVLAAAVLALCSDANSAEPEINGADDSVRRVDALQRNGWKVTATFPIFHQIVALSFPKGFVPACEEARGPSYIQESVLHGETAEKWSQMITITGAQGAAASPEVTPDRVTGSLVSGFQRTCPSTFSGLRMPPGELAKYCAIIVVVGCGTVNDHGIQRSEAMLLATLKGDQDYYTVQWAERGPASPTALTFDAKTWADRLRQLLPIRICTKVAGEAAPFPSCIGPAGG